MKLLSKVGSLALIAAVAGGVVAGCSGSEMKSTGAAKEGAANTVGLALQPVAGVTINTVHFVVTKAGVTLPVLEGDLPTPGTASTFNVGLPIPVGTGYTLSLSGVSVESATVTCAGAVGPFDVLPNVSKQLVSTLSCSDSSVGSLNDHVTVTTDACPHLVVDFLVITPNSANTTETIGVFSKSHDTDGKPITTAWTVGGTPAIGTFAAPTAANTTFTCVTKGANVPLTVTVNNGQCSKSLTTDVSCTSKTCGNGLHDTGELCDPTAGDTTCLPNCTPTHCGDGNVESPIEQCDPVPANSDICTATCQIRPIACGDGFLETGEECDGLKFPVGTPAGATCSALCKITLAPPPDVCGDGRVGPTTVCDTAFSVNDCGSDCKTITTAACFTCENDPATCADFVNCDALGGVAAAGSPAAGVKKSVLCNEVLDCIRDSGCAANGKNLSSCYCGSANAADCQDPTLANGVCKTQFTRGMESTTFATIAARLKDGRFGGGVAGARIDCDQQACPTQCGL